MYEIKTNLMKNILFSLAILAISFSLKGQCDPDLENCIDVNEPGQICPEQLANGNVDSQYEEVITILTPDSVSLGDAKIGIGKITLDSIHNLPPGLEFHGESLEFFPDEAYCVTISGTPEQEGTYFLKIYVTPYLVWLNNYISLGAQVDSTSVSLTVEASLGIDYIDKEEFSLIHAYPNPFMTSTRIGYLEPDQGEAELIISNMLGRQIYRERMHVVEGENYFNFKGDELPPGYYIYAILRENKSLKGKLLKRR